MNYSKLLIDALKPANLQEPGYLICKDCGLRISHTDRSDIFFICKACAASRLVYAQERCPCNDKECEYSTEKGRE